MVYCRVFVNMPLCDNNTVNDSCLGVVKTFGLDWLLQARYFSDEWLTTDKVMCYMISYKSNNIF